MIQSCWGKRKTPTFVELLIDCEEDRTLQVVLVGMLGRTRGDSGERIALAIATTTGGPSGL